MERSSKLMLLAMCLYTLSLVEYTPAFMPMASGMQSSITSSLRGSAGAKAPPQISMASGLRSAAALVAVSAAAMSVRGSRAQARARVQLQVTRSPLVVYCCALNNGAVKQKEAVQVAQDMMKIKNAYEDKEWIMAQEEWINNAAYREDQPKCEKMKEVLGPFQSTVVPKFMDFLQKKLRLEQLPAIATEYVNELYFKQDIAPVKVTTAQELTPEQKDSLVAKMKQKTGAADIKMKYQVDENLRGGLLVEWKFQDPDNMDDPIYVIDNTLRRYVETQAVKVGVGS